MKAIIIHGGVEIAELTNLTTPQYGSYDEILDECYITTNHIGGNWTRDRRVTLLKPGSHRSTMVGDRIRLEYDDDPLAYSWEVTRLGFARAGVTVKRSKK